MNKTIKETSSDLRRKENPVNQTLFNFHNTSESDRTKLWKRSRELVDINDIKMNKFPKNVMSEGLASWEYPEKPEVKGGQIEFSISLNNNNIPVLLKTNSIRGQNSPSQPLLEV